MESKKRKKLILICLSASIFLSACLFSSFKITEAVKKYKSNSVSKSIKDKNKNKKNIKLLKKQTKEQNSKTEVNSLAYNFSDWNKGLVDTKNESDITMVVVNKNNGVPDEIAKNIEKNLKRCGKKDVGKVIYDDLCKMFDDAKKDGINLWVCSGYRSQKYQEGLFNRQLNIMQKRGFKGEEAIKMAEKSVAKPGHSEHNIGLAVDINCADSQLKFEDSAEYKWLNKNAHKYGFIERYPKGKEYLTGCIFEPWHWRYVGKEDAKEIKNSGKTLEEYVICKLSSRK